MAQETEAPFSINRKDAITSRLIQYQHEPLPTPKATRFFQLVGRNKQSCELYGTIQTAELSEAADDFIALSYTWGAAEMTSPQQVTPDQPRYRLIICPNTKAVGVSSHGPSVSAAEYVYATKDHFELPVTKNLEHALKSFADILDENSVAENESQLSYPRWPFQWSTSPQLWIDALCINQNDETEKHQQVLMMDEIYSKASLVTVWLGRESDNSKTVSWLHEIVFPVYLRSVTSLGSNPSPGDLQKLKIFDQQFWLDVANISLPASVPTWFACWQSLYDFIDERSWFERLWVVQELALAPKVLLLCGKQFLFWQRLFNIFFYTSMSGWFYGPLALQNNLSTATASQKVIDLGFIRKRLQSQTTGWKSILSEAATTARKKKVSVPEDRIYGLLGIWKKALGDDATKLTFLRSPAPCLRDLYKEATVLLYGECSLNHISSATSKSEQRTLGLPTWVIDFDVPGILNSFDVIQGFECSGKAALGVVEKDGRLSMSGINIGHIEKLETHEQLTTSLSSSLLHLFGPQTWSGLDYGRNGSFMQMLWRTLVVDNNMKFETPAPKHWEHQFLDFLLFNIMADLRNGEAFYTKDPQPILRRWDQIADLVSLEDKEFHSLLVPLVETSRRHAMDSLEEQNNIMIPLYHGSSWEYFRKHEFYQPNGYYFRLSSGRFAYSSGCLEAGDEIWIVDGVGFPLVLRRQVGAGEAKHAFVSGAYVHGVMYGELVEELQNGRQPIILV